MQLNTVWDQKTENPSLDYRPASYSLSIGRPLPQRKRLEIIADHSLTCGPGSVVGIATAYGLDGPGIESRWGKIFRTCPNRP